MCHFPAGGFNNQALRTNVHTHTHRNTRTHKEKHTHTGKQTLLCRLPERSIQRSLKYFINTGFSEACSTNIPPLPPRPAPLLQNTPSLLLTSHHHHDSQKPIIWEIDLPKTHRHVTCLIGFGMASPNPKKRFLKGAIHSVSILLASSVEYLFAKKHKNVLCGAFGFVERLQKGNRPPQPNSTKTQTRCLWDVFCLKTNIATVLLQE